METRANYVWVGAVTLGLLALAAGLAMWLVHVSQSQRKFYDIYFRQSVDGLAKGATVTLSGVPAGLITDIELSHADPSVVRVRVGIEPEMPILMGTSATIQSSFTGVSAVQLSGGAKGAAPIVGQGPDGVPVIPTRASGLGELLSSAPVLMQRLGDLTARLGDFFSPKNQKSLEGILANTNRMTADLAQATPQTKQVLADLAVTLQEATVTLGEFQKTAAAANAQLDPGGDSAMRQLRETLKSAQAASDSLRVAAAEATPAAQRINRDTIPQAEAAIRELRATAKALREITEKIDNQGAVAALRAPKLPEYHP